MNTTFKVKVNESYEFDFNKNQIEKLDLIRESSDNFHVLENNQSFKGKLLKSDFNNKKYTVKINGNNYEVAISNDLDVLISELGLEAVTSKKENNLKAPMPGLIVSVDINEGQEVKEGESILILEAMKMENTLVAPKDGIVKSIKIKAGDKVEKNELLIEME